MADMFVSVLPSVALDKPPISKVCHAEYICVFYFFAAGNFSFDKLRGLIAVKIMTTD
jgi:hypothetical protein